MKAIRANQKRFTQRRGFWAVQSQKKNRERRTAAPSVLIQLSGENGTAIYGEQNEQITSQ